MLRFGFKNHGSTLPRTGLLFYSRLPNTEGILWDEEALWDENMLWGGWVLPVECYPLVEHDDGFWFTDSTTPVARTGEEILAWPWINTGNIEFSLAAGLSVRWNRVAYYKRNSLTDADGANTRTLYGLQYIHLTGSTDFTNASIVGTETVTSQPAGTAVITVAAGKLTIAAGDLWSFALSNGSTYEFGTILTATTGVVFDTSGNGRHLLFTVADTAVVCISGSRDKGSDAFNEGGFLVSNGNYLININDAYNVPDRVEIPMLIDSIDSAALLIDAAPILPSENLMLKAETLNFDDVSSAVMDTSNDSTYLAGPKVSLGIDTPQTITFSGMVSGVTVTSHSGSATVSLTNGTLSCSGTGSLFDMVLSDGSTYSCAQGSGDYIICDQPGKPVGKLIGFNLETCWYRSLSVGHKWQDYSYQLPMWQQITNYNFVNGLTGWTGPRGTKTIVDGSVRITRVVAYPYADLRTSAATNIKAGRTYDVQVSWSKGNSVTPPWINLFALGAMPDQSSPFYTDGVSSFSFTALNDANYFEVRSTSDVDTYNTIHYVSVRERSKGMVPGNVANAGFDVFGNALNRNGPGRNDLSITGFWLKTDGILYLSAPWATGSELVVRTNGSARVKITPGRIAFTEGEIGYLLLNDGTELILQANLTSQQTTVYDISSQEHNCTIIDGPETPFTATSVAAEPSLYEYLYTDFLNPVYPAPLSGNTYYVRADGTAASVAAATSPDSASSAMSPSTLSALYLDITDGDTVVFSGQGGDYVEQIYLKAGGSGPTSRIAYIADLSDPPLFTKMVRVLNGYMDIVDLPADCPTEITCWSFNGSDSSLVAPIVGVRTYNIKALNSTNQGVQHEESWDKDNPTVEVIHYNFYGDGCLDEAVSCHSNPLVTLVGGAIRNCGSGINWATSPRLRVSGMYIGGKSLPIEIPLFDYVADVEVEGCVLVKELPTGLVTMQALLGHVGFDSCIFSGVTGRLINYSATLSTGYFTNNHIKAATVKNDAAIDCSGNTFYVDNSIAFEGVSGDISDTTISSISTLDTHVVDMFSKGFMLSDDTLIPARGDGLSANGLVITTKPYALSGDHYLLHAANSATMYDLTVLAGVDGDFYTDGVADGLTPDEWISLVANGNIDNCLMLSTQTNMLSAWNPAISGTEVTAATRFLLGMEPSPSHLQYPGQAKLNITPISHPTDTTLTPTHTYSLADSHQMRTALGWAWGVDHWAYTDAGVPKVVSYETMVTNGIGPRCYVGTKGAAVYEVDMDTAPADKDAKIKKYLKVPS